MSDVAGRLLEPNRASLPVKIVICRKNGLISTPPMRRKKYMGIGGKNTNKSTNKPEDTDEPSRRDTVYGNDAEVPKSVSMLARLLGGHSFPQTFAVSEMDQNTAEQILHGLQSCNVNK